MISALRETTMEEGVPPSSAQPRMSFGAFEVYPKAGELRKDGSRIKLHEKPFELLLALLERPGEIVLRSELQERLWPEHPIVDVENGLNNAMGRLREALGDTAENPRVVETIPRRGYRLLPQVSQTIPFPRDARSSRSRLLRLTFVAALGASVAVGALVMHFAAFRSTAIHSVAVLPFRDLGTTAPEGSFSAGMTDAVATDLAEAGVAKIASESSAARFSRTRYTIPQIGRALGVNALVVGDVLREGDEVRITVHLVRANTNRQIWADTYEGPMTNVLGLQDRVAESIAKAIDLRLSSGKAEKLTALANERR